MRWFVKSAFVLAALLLLFLLRPDAPVREQRLDGAAIDAEVREALKAWNVPGAAVVIVRGDEVVYLAGHGLRSLDGGEPITPDTIFPLASCSKGFTTAAMGILVDEGKLDWDDPVRKHVPYFRLSDPLADRDVRLRDLLCHRTGLGTHDLLWHNAPWSPEEAVRRAAYLPLERPFRTGMIYQNTMYTAVGLAVSSAAGKPWHEFVRERLLEPLDMKATVFTAADAAKCPDRARGHQLNRTGRPEPVDWYAANAPDAAGSIHSTARDLGKWLIFQLGDGTAGTKRLVSAKNFAEPHAPQLALRVEGHERDLHPDTLQMSYGMGWLLHDYRGHLLVSHTGLIDGFRVQITLAKKEKIGVAILSNLYGTRLNLALGNNLMDRLLGLPRKDWNAILQAAMRKHDEAAAAAARAELAKRHPGTHPTRELPAYAGEYEHPAYGKIRVSVNGEKLVWSWNQHAIPMEHFDFDTFLVPEEAVTYPFVTFLPDEKGAPAAMKVTGQINLEFKRVARR